jgi:CRP-like cAMP-binding protein
LVFQPEETIIHDGEIGDAMYFIVEGKVSVLNKSKNVLVALQKGDFFGALVLVFSILRTASVATLGVKPVTVAKLGREGIEGPFCVL